MFRSCSGTGKGHFDVHFNIRISVKLFESSFGSWFYCFKWVLNGWNGFHIIPDHLHLTFRTSPNHYGIYPELFRYRKRSFGRSFQHAYKCQVIRIFVLHLEMAYKWSEWLPCHSEIVPMLFRTTPETFRSSSGTVQSYSNLRFEIRIFVLTLKMASKPP